MKKSELKQIIKEELKKALQKEMSTTGDVAGFETPNAFNTDEDADGSSADLEVFGYKKVKKKKKDSEVEPSTVPGGMAERIMRRVLAKLSESKKPINEISIFGPFVVLPIIDKTHLLRMYSDAATAYKRYSNGAYTFPKNDYRLAAIAIAKLLKTKHGVSDIQAELDSVVERKEMTENYNTYKKDESLTPQQKINKAIGEVKNMVNEMEKSIDRNIRLKTEMGVQSGSYWKRTHKNLNKISERFIAMSNKIKRLSE